MDFINKIDDGAQGVDNMANKLLGDGGDPELAPPGQQTMDAEKVLEGLSECQLTEKASAIEAVSAFAGAGQEFEMPNKYKVLDPDGNQVFFIVENTDMCTRQCKNCAGDCAPWNVQIRVIAEDGSAEEAYTLERPWTCTCCCFCRPTVTITNVRTGDVVGKMIDPFACCDLTFKIKDGDDEDQMYVKGGCCQWGLCCQLPCGPCAEVNFDIQDANGEDVGHITKKVPSCLKFLAAPDVDNYHMRLDGIQDPNMKLAAIAVAVFIDFRFFSVNANAQDEDGDHIPDRFDWNNDSGDDE